MGIYKTIDYLYHGERTIGIGFYPFEKVMSAHLWPLPILNIPPRPETNGKGVKYMQGEPAKARLPKGLFATRPEYRILYTPLTAIKTTEAITVHMRRIDELV